ncbi:ribonuclease H protein [Trifolium medium]|uniref:Ribonuclease H protein n=1 Tax=Trifolium medium TaxID=97028 RepID=A0A392Q462_9FABA|nr:ribonuclease H protein [Trifolium medium]
MKYANAPTIKEVLHPCGRIFRNLEALFSGAYASNLGTNTSLNTKLVGVMLALEIVPQKGWSHLLLATDFMLVVLAFSCAKVVPWPLRNRWDEC